jgi:hypothetical protein
MQEGAPRIVSRLKGPLQQVPALGRPVQDLRQVPGDCPSFGDARQAFALTSRSDLLHKLRANETMDTRAHVLILRSVNERGWGWSASEIRRVQLLERVADEPVEHPGEYAEVKAFYDARPDQNENAIGVANDDLTYLTEHGSSRTAPASAASSP